MTWMTAIPWRGSITIPRFPSDVIANAQQRMSWQGPLNHFHERVSKQPIGKRGRDTLDKLMPHVLQQLQHAHACGDVVALVTNVLIKLCRAPPI